jgi:hypothetical protein
MCSAWLLAFALGFAPNPGIPGQINDESTIGRGLQPGTGLIAVSEANGGRTVRSVDKHGKVGQPLLTTRDYIAHPNASADGKMIYFVGGKYRLGSTSLYQYEIGKGEYKRLTTKSLSRVDSLAMLPKAGQVAILVAEEQQRVMAGSPWASHNVYLYDIASQKIRKATSLNFVSASFLRSGWNGADLTFVGRTYPNSQLVRLTGPNMKVFSKRIPDRYTSSVIANGETLLIGHDDSYPFVYSLHRINAGMFTRLPLAGNNVTSAVEIGRGLLLLLCQDRVTKRYSLQVARVAKSGDK